MKKSTKINEKPLKPKQLAMIEALKAQLGNVTAAISQVGIDRTTHYLWLRKNPKYVEEVNKIPDIVLDFAESALHKQILNNDTRAIIFFLKSKGKSRGYNEKKEIEIKGNITNTLSKEQLDETIKRLNV